MNRLWYVWTAGHDGGPIRRTAALAASEEEAAAKVELLLTSWDGPITIMKVTTDENYAPRKEYVW